MITVRFPTGLSVQYNDATTGAYRADGWFELHNARGGWIASVPPVAIIEVVAPCRTYSTVRDETTETVRGLMQSEFKTIQRQIRALGKKTI